MITEEHTLAAVASLRDAGFALQWLHPRQKRPIGKDWQERPVASLDELHRTWAPSNNLGLRLGEPSRVGSGYLHVIDLDIRVEDVVDEAWEALHALLPSVDGLPSVISGSGGASRHLYFISEKPFRSKRLAASEGKHRREKVDPVTGEVKQGWSHDWEIELFGTGKQVVLPPSIHPDTGQPYCWEREFDLLGLSLGLEPLIAAVTIETLGAVDPTTYEYETREPLDFKPGQLERELDLVPVSDLHYDDWIRLGQALHHQFGGSQDGFDLWLKHTRRSSKYTGESQDREMRRSKWRSFGRYRGKPVTMATIRTWAMEARSAAFADAFDDLEDEDEDDTPDPFEDLLGGSETPPAATAAKEFDPLSDTSSEAPSWRSLLDLNEEGVIRPTLHNLRLIVENDVWTRELVAFNEFTQEIVQRGAPGRKAERRKNAPKPILQLEGLAWGLKDPVNGDFWTEDKDHAIRSRLEAPKTQGGYGIKIPDRDLKAAIDIAGRRNSFHPVREYLQGLTWDGKPRIERLFIDYLGAPDDNYSRSVGRLMMIAAVTRVFEPGHKFDFCVILEGIQGKRKSTFISTLARNWFDELDGDFEDGKEMVEKMQGAWIMEIPELSGFAKADVRHIKAFISRTTDKVRLAYARRAHEYERQCIFIGSTNDDVYLKDDTGGRRWWPVRCEVEEIETDRLKVDLDQLWAEALQGYRSMREAQPYGTLPLYLADSEAQVIAARLQDSRKVETPDDALAGQIAEWLSRPINNGGFDDNPSGAAAFRDHTCLVEIWCDCLGRDLAQYVGAWPSTLGRAMRLIPDWIPSGGRHRFGKHGQQRAYVRKA